MLKQLNKVGFAALLIMAFLAIPAASQAKEADSNDTVVAIVNGTKIYKKDVLEAMKGLSVKKEEADKAFPIIVDQMINEKLIDNATTKANIEKDPAFQARLATAKEQMIKTFYLENYLKDFVTDKAVKAEYEKFKKENKGKEEVHARHILVQTEAEAKQAIKDLDGGAKFADLAKQRSSGPTAQNGGDVGFFAKGEIIPEFSDAAFKLKPGTYTKEPVKSPFGWHVIYVESKRQRAVPDMKDVDGAIRSRLGQNAIEKLVQDLRAKAEIKHFDMDGKPVEETKKN